MLQRRGRFGRARDRPARAPAGSAFRSRPAAIRCRKLLVQDPLVQGVLVDDRHALVALGDEVAVVDLQGRGRRPSRRGGLGRRGLSAARRRHSTGGRLVESSSSVPASGSSGRSSRLQVQRLPRRWPTGRRRVAAAGIAARGRRPLPQAATLPLAQSTSCWRNCAAWAASCPPVGSSSVVAGVVAGRLHARVQVGRQELAPQRGQQLAVEPAGVLEADFELRRMDVHVDQFRRHLQRQEGDRIAARSSTARDRPRPGRAAATRSRMCRPLRNRYCMRLWLRLWLGWADVAGEPHVAVDAFDPDQVLGQFAAEERRDPLQPAVAGRPARTPAGRCAAA